MNKGKGALVLSKIIEKIQLVFGVIFTFTFSYSTITFIIDRGALNEIILAIVMTGLGIWLIILSKKRKKLISDFKTYVARLSTDPTGSIENLALGLGTSQDVVTKNLQQMIIKKYFVNAYIDSMNNRIVLAHVGEHINNSSNSIQNVSNSYMDNQNAKDMEYVSVTCKNCGGINKITNGKVGECEYCGSPING